MIPSTEDLLCSPLGFDLQTASPVQRARCRIGDGLPLGELRAHPDVVAMVGGPEAVEALPSERGIAPRMVVDVSSIRSAKTLMACCRSARAVFAVSVAGLRIGEVPRIPIFSLKLNRARVAFRMLEALFSRPALKPLVVSSTAETLTVSHPSGVPVEIVCCAGGRAAQDFVGDWLVAFVADEAPRMLGRDDGVVNLADALSAIRGRVLTGGQIQLIGSPWAPSGPVYDLVSERFGKPDEQCVILRSNGPQNNPGHFTPELCAELEETDPVAYQTSVIAEFADPESGLLSPVAVRRNTRETPLELLPENGAEYAAAVDPSEGGAGGNAWTLVIVEIQVDHSDDGSERPYYRVALAKEWRGLSPDQCWQEIARDCQRYGLKSATTDQYAASANQDLARRYGLQLEIEKTTATSKLEDFTNLATLIHTDSIELPPDRQFRSDLLAIKRRATQAGATIVLPKTGDGRHCDFAPALAAAVKRGGRGFGRDGHAMIIPYYNSTEPFRGIQRRKDYRQPYAQRVKDFIND